MAINFPASPSTNDTHTENAITWIFNGTSWNAQGDQVTAASIGLGNVDNTADANKPVSTATQTALDEVSAEAELKAIFSIPDEGSESDFRHPLARRERRCLARFVRGTRPLPCCPLGGNRDGDLAQTLAAHRDDVPNVQKAGRVAAELRRKLLEPIHAQQAG